MLVSELLEAEGSVHSPVFPYGDFESKHWDAGVPEGGQKGSATKEIR
jgi:hypothetical protein